MINWMNCNTCRRTVWLNETGICRACQGGFSGELCEDDYFMQTTNKVKERIDAIEERIEQIDNQAEHQDGDEAWKTEKTGYRNFPPNCS